MATAPAKPRARATSPAKATARKKSAKKKSTRKTTAKKSARKTTAKKSSKKVSTKKTSAKKTSAKKTATKKTAARPSKPAKYPFPFFGAGAAAYFEWGGLYVWFEDPPPRAARSKLLKKIPEPFRHDAGWGGPVLHATSGDQFINLHICTAYAKLGDPDDEDRGDPGDEDYMDGLEFGVGQPFPNSKQMKAFEADIDAWLLALHRQHRIAFVARREDSEAGGTRLSAWHRWSLTRFADVVLPLWRAHHARPKHRLMDWAFHEVVGLALDSDIADTVPAAVRTWYAKDR